MALLSENRYKSGIFAKVIRMNGDYANKLLLSDKSRYKEILDDLEIIANKFHYIHSFFRKFVEPMTDPTYLLGGTAIISIQKGYKILYKEFLVELEALNKYITAFNDKH
jgi:hypothetical protein